MSNRPLAFTIHEPNNGDEPWLTIDAAGNRATVLVSETYDESRSAANVIHLVIDAVKRGDFLIRYATEHREAAAEVTP